jgi:hypothetical protein
MEKAIRLKIKQDLNKDPKVGEGFNDQRGDIPELGPIPRHNGQNINNEPRGLKQRDNEKAERRPMPTKP